MIWAVGISLASHIEGEELAWVTPIGWMLITALILIGAFWRRPRHFPRSGDARADTPGSSHGQHCHVCHNGHSV